MAEGKKKVPKRIAQTVIGSLKGGVVPRIGLPYITVGRKNEIEALLHDVDIITEGGASFRFIVGKYGSGKSFLIQTIRNYVMDRGFIVADADLSPERRLQGTKGQGLATYRELIGNLSTKTKPEGGALTLVLDRWINSVQIEAAQETGLMPGDPALTAAVDRKIYEVTSAVSELVHGFEFAKLLSLYYHAYVEGDDDRKMKVVRWFRGEYALKREAREELGVNIIITDDDWYDYLKLFATFFRLAGYTGMMIMIDELVNIYKIPNSITRQYNYEKMLTMYNDTLQGKARYLGIIMGATPRHWRTSGAAFTAMRRFVHACRRASSQGPARGIFWPRSSGWNRSPRKKCWCSARNWRIFTPTSTAIRESSSQTTSSPLLSWSTAGSARTGISLPEKSSGTLLNCWISCTRIRTCASKS